jgi:hypothetical protein
VASREEAPEESIFLKRDAASSGFRIVGSEAGRKRDRPKKGRGTSDGLALCAGWVPGKTSEPSGGAVKYGGRAPPPEGAVGWDATPELVSQDRERVRLAFGSSGPGYEHRQILRSAHGRARDRVPPGRKPWQIARPGAMHQPPGLFGDLAEGVSGRVGPPPHSLGPGEDSSVG